MNGTIWRIVLFFVGAVFIMGLVIPYDDDNLAKIGDVSTISVSPFTIVFDKSGIPGASHVMNAVILTTILSAGNSGLYLCTRIFWTLSMEGKAPRVFQRLTKGGIPIYCLILTTVLSTSIFGLSFVGSNTIYTWLVNMTSVMGFIAWFGIALSHWRFRRAFLKQGYSLNDLVYKALFFPVGPFFASILIAFCVFGQGYSAWTTVKYNCSDHTNSSSFYLNNEIPFVLLDNNSNETNATCTRTEFSLSQLLSGYVILPIFVLMYFVYKFVKKTRIIPLAEIDLMTDSILLRQEYENINS